MQNNRANRAQFLDFSIHGLSTSDEVAVLEMPQIRSEEDEEENDECMSDSTLLKINVFILKLFLVYRA